MTGCKLINNSTVNSDGFPVCGIDMNSQSLSTCDHYTRYMGYNGRHTCSNYDRKYRECLNEEAIKEAKLDRRLENL